MGIGYLEVMTERELFSWQFLLSLRDAGHCSVNSMRLRFCHLDDATREEPLSKVHISPFLPTFCGQKVRRDWEKN